MATCGKPTKLGKPCGWHTGACPYHSGRPETRPPQVARPAHAGEAPEDLRAFGWWLIRGVLGETVEVQKGSVLVAAARLIAALGPESEADDQALAAAVLRGRVMHGLAPEGDAEWDLARALFTAEALAEIRRWAESVEPDLVHHREPGGLRQASALEREVSRGSDVDDGVRAQF